MSNQSSDHWTRIQPLLDGAADLPPVERRPWLCAQTNDESLIEEVLSIIAAGESEDEFLDPAMGPAPDTPLPGPGDRVGRWELLREIGRGGMGVVHLAKHSGDGFEQLGVVKFPLAVQRGRNARERFRRERHVLGRLRHPNIASLLDGGEPGDEHPYCVLEFAAGVPIDQYVADGALDAKAVVRLFLQLLDAVDFAHRNLVLHRDIKPSNVMVGENGHVKLLDFGIAKLLDSDDPGELTQAGPVPLTPRYASPEQVNGGLITTASDIYQLGVLLYDLLCGPQARTRTTDRHGATTTAISIVPTQVEGVRRGVSKDLDRIVLSAADLDPQRRYASATEMAADLRRWLDDLPVLVRASSAGYRFRLFLRRNRAAVAVATVATLALLAFGSLAVLRLKAERDAAELRASENEELVEFFSGIFRGADPDAGGEARTVRDMVQSSLQSLETELGDQPQARARLSLAAAQLALNVGLDREAGEVFGRILEAHRADPDGRRDPDFHAALLAWAQEQGRQQEYASSADLYRELLSAYEASGKAEDEDAARAWLRLADALVLDRQNEAALEAFDEGYRLALENDLEIDTNAQITRARLLSRADRTKEAERAYRSILRNHPDAAAHQSLGVLLRKQERFEEAVEQFQAAVDLATRDLGAAHHNTLLIRGYLARGLADIGLADAAIDTLRANISLARATYGEGHWRVGSKLSSLGRALFEHDRLEEATKVLRDAWRHQALALGEDHTWTLCSAFRYRSSMLAHEPSAAGVEALAGVVEEMYRRTREDEDGLDRAISKETITAAADVCRQHGEPALAERIDALLPGIARRVSDDAETSG